MSDHGTEPPGAEKTADLHFEDGPTDPLHRLQRFLHAAPTIVPVAVLVLSVLVFSADRRHALLPPVQPVADHAAGDDHRGDRRGADPRDPHRRHRPLGRRDHDPRLDRHGPARGRRRPAAGGRLPDRPRRRHRLRPDQRPPRHLPAPAALHRHPRDVERLRRDVPLALRQPDHPRPGSRRGGAAPPGDRLGDPDRRRPADHGHGRGGRDRGGGLVHAEPHRLRPAHLRHRRRPRGRAPRRHRHPPRAPRHLHPRRLHLRARRLGADRPHRRDQPDLGRHRQPRLRSPPSSSAAPASSAAAARSSAPSSAR